MTQPCELYPNEIRFATRIFDRLAYLLDRRSEASKINQYGLSRYISDLAFDTVWTQPQPCCPLTTITLVEDIIVEQLESEAENAKHENYDDPDDPFIDQWRFINEDGIGGIDQVFEAFGVDLIDRFQNYADNMASAYDVELA